MVWAAYRGTDDALPNDSAGKGTERQPCQPVFSGLDCLCDRYPVYRRALQSRGGVWISRFFLVSQRQSTDAFQFSLNDSLPMSSMHIEIPDFLTRSLQDRPRARRKSAWRLAASPSSSSATR